MRRGFVVAIGGAAVVVAGLAGCGSEGDSSTSESSSSASSSSEASSSESATENPTSLPQDVKVTIDGEDQEISGTPTCATIGGNINIAIGEGTTAIAVVLSEGDPPTVESVGLGNVNGVTLGYVAGVPGGEGSATKDGDTYTIEGKATGIDTANPLQPITKPFEIEVTCP